MWLQATTYSIASSRHPDALHVPRWFSLRLDVYPSSQVLQIDRWFYHSTSASHVDEEIVCSRVPSLHGRYPASSLLQTQPPPSRLQTLSRCCRLYALPCSADFSNGARTVSPVAWRFLVTVPPLPPRRSGLPLRSGCGRPCCLRAKAERSASGVYFFVGATSGFTCVVAR